MSNIKEILKSGLVVSCQALEDEPLYSSYIMAKMALAAYQGGAVGIRANSGVDIKAIKREVNLPIIGIVKKQYSDSNMYITPTMKEVTEVFKAGAEIVAVDATNRRRPNNEALEDFVSEIRKTYPSLYLMADIATFEEGKRAEALGFDLISTTLHGYTEDTKDACLPNIKLVKELVNGIKIPIITEGGVWEPKDANDAMNNGSYAVVIGTAITRPREITKRFVESIKTRN